MKSGGQINCVSWDTWTPLHEAIAFDHLHMVEYLVSMGADTTIETVSRVEPFFPCIGLRWSLGAHRDSNPGKVIAGNLLLGNWVKLIIEFVTDSPPDTSRDGYSSRTKYHYQGSEKCS